jgi:hypothetical protein
MRSIFFACLLVAVAGCPSTGKPTPTGTTCADPDPVTGTTTLTWQNFGYDFMCHYCTNCHDSSLKLDQRNGAPLFHDFDSLIGVMEVPDHIDEQAGSGPNAHNTFMPGAGTGGKCPSTPGGPLDESCMEPTAEERQQLSQWVACQRLRTAENASPAAQMTDHCAAYTGPR